MDLYSIKVHNQNYSTSIILKRNFHLLYIPILIFHHYYQYHYQKIFLFIFASKPINTKLKMASQNIIPILLFSLSIFAMILNLIADFSNGKFITWKTFNATALTTLLAIVSCIFIWIVSSRAEMFSSIQFTSNTLINFSLMIFASMYMTYQEFLLFKNVMRWISSRTSPFDLRYSLYAILIPLIVMIVKMPFTNTLDSFPKDFWGALTYDYGFWHFITAISIVYAVVMVIIQLIQFVVLLRNHISYLILVFFIYPLVMSSIFFLSMYAVVGIVLLFVIYFVLKIISSPNKRSEDDE